MKSGSVTQALPSFTYTLNVQFSFEGCKDAEGLAFVASKEHSAVSLSIEGLAMSAEVEVETSSATTESLQANYRD